MAFRCTKPTPHPVKTLAYEPWELAVEPFQGGSSDLVRGRADLGWMLSD